jgi:hypothetical protein
VWPDGQTAHDIVRKLRDNDVDAVMILMASGAGAYSIGQLFGAMRDMDWVPDSISFGGLDSTLSVALLTRAAQLVVAHDMLLTLTTTCTCVLQNRLLSRGHEQ